MRERKRIVVIGDALIDNLLYIDRLPMAGEDIKVNDYAKNTGGSAANTAALLACFGVEVCLISCAGKDEDANTIIERLGKMGVDTSLISKQGQTGFTVTLVGSDGERTMLSLRGACERAPEFTSVMRERIENSDMLFVSGYWMQSKEQAEFVLKAAQAAKSANALAAFDPCPIVGGVDEKLLHSMLKLTDILLPNEAEHGFLKQRHSLRLPCVAVKLGNRGSKLMYQGKEYVEAAQKIKPVDTTGAGDAFNAGFLAAVLMGEEPQSWLKKGNECAAKAVGRRGAL